MKLLLKIAYFTFILLGGTYLMEDGINIFFGKSLSYLDTLQIAYTVVGASWLWNVNKDLKEMQ